jgi:hypothetical protein
MGSACLLTDPAAMRTPFGDTNMPEPIIDPTIIPTPFISPIFLFSLTLEFEEESEALPFGGGWFPCSISAAFSADILLAFVKKVDRKWTDFLYTS